MDTQIQYFIQLLVISLIGIAMPIAIRAIAGVIKQALGQLSADQIALFEDVLRTAVLAAEQAGLAGYIEQTGEAKKAEAIRIALAYLEKVGLGKIDVSLIASAIEAAVFTEFGDQ